MKSIYLDYNATTPVAPSVKDAILPYLLEHFGNPSSPYAGGLAALEAVEEARERVAFLLGASSEEIVFTSGGTEANNLALKGVLLHPERFRNSGPSGLHMVISAIEHPAVAEPTRYLEQLGIQVSAVAPNAQGVVEPAAVQRALRPETVLVSVMHANNEIGTIQPIREIAELCRSRDILVHTDAAQSVGKISVNVEELQVDLLSLAGHKIYAPKGVGALYVRRGTDLAPWLHGGGQELGLRAGTENVPYLAGLAQAARLAVTSSQEFDGRIRELRDLLWQTLRDAISDLHCHGESAARLPNTLSVAFPGVRGADLLVAVPEISASTGSACHGRSGVGSATLRAIGATPELARGTVRFSLGWYTTAEEVDRAAQLLIDAWERLAAQPSGAAD